MERVIVVYSSSSGWGEGESLFGHTNTDTHTHTTPHHTTSPRAESVV
jgi:hypothetical protein